MVTLVAFKFFVIVWSGSLWFKLAFSLFTFWGNGTKNSLVGNDQWQVLTKIMALKKKKV